MMLPTVSHRLARPAAAGCRTTFRSSRSVRNSNRMTAVHAIKVGDQLPYFELETDQSNPDNKVTINSTDMVRDSGAVIFVYPKAATSGCTVQACGFRDEYGKFTSAGYKTYGLSADSPAEQAAWKAEHGFQYPLLCDTGFQVLPLLGMASTDHKITRSHVVVEKGGVVSEVQLGISSGKSVPEALSFLVKAHKL